MHISKIAAKIVPESAELRQNRKGNALSGYFAYKKSAHEFFSHTRIRDLNPR